MNAISTLVFIFVSIEDQSIQLYIVVSFCVPTPLLDMILESFFEFKINLLDYVTVGYILNMPFIFFM